MSLAPTTIGETLEAAAQAAEPSAADLYPFDKLLATPEFLPPGSDITNAMLAAFPSMSDGITLKGRYFPFGIKNPFTKDRDATHQTTLKVDPKKANVTTVRFSDKAYGGLADPFFVYTKAIETALSQWWGTSGAPLNLLGEEASKDATFEKVYASGVKDSKAKDLGFGNGDERRAAPPKEYLRDLKTRLDLSVEPSIEDEEGNCNPPIPEAAETPARMTTVTFSPEVVAAYTKEVAGPTSKVLRIPYIEQLFRSPYRADVTLRPSFVFYMPETGKLYCSLFVTRIRVTSIYGDYASKARQTPGLTVASIMPRLRTTSTSSAPKPIAKQARGKNFGPRRKAPVAPQVGTRRQRSVAPPSIVGMVDAAAAADESSDGDVSEPVPALEGDDSEPVEIVRPPAKKARRSAAA